MKTLKILLLSLLCLESMMIHAQTNTFPDDGNVGVGTTNPTQKLEVNGTLLSKNFLSNPSNTSFHHFIRNGVGAAVYINQISNNSAHPILRLSSGTATANQGVKFTIENDGNVGVNTAIPLSRINNKGLHISMGGLQ